MMTATPHSRPSRSVRSETADVVTVILFGIGAAVTVVIMTVLRILDIFRPVGIAWTVPIDDMVIDATMNSGSTSMEGIAGEVTVIVSEVDTVAAAAIIASIATWALAALLIIGCVTHVARSFLQSRFFVRSTARAFDIIGWTLVLGAVLVLLLDNVGRNGVLAALDITGEPLHFIEFAAFAPVWAIGVATGLIAMGFRRGIRLQRETEGLV